MASFSQAIYDAFAAIFQFFASIMQTIVSAFQSLISLFGAAIKEVANISAGLVRFLMNNIVVVLAVIGAFFLFATYSRYQGRLGDQKKKVS